MKSCMNEYRLCAFRQDQVEHLKMNIAVTIIVLLVSDAFYVKEAMTTRVKTFYREVVTDSEQCLGKKSKNVFQFF